MIISSVMGMKRFISSLFIILLYIPLSYAIGISPSMIKMDFQPGFEQTFYFTVSGVTSSKISVHGSLAPYITVSDEVLVNKNTFTATIKLPEKMDIPGINKGFIEVIEAKEGQEGVVAGVVAIETPIYVRVPYPGKYVEITFTVPDVNVNETAHFYVNIINRGTLNITRAHADIEVKDAENKTIAKVKADAKPVLSGSDVTLTAEKGTAGYRAGGYMAYADVYYDEEQMALSTSFRVGSLNIKLINYTKEFLKDTINKFEIELESGWNNKVKDLYASIIIGNETAEIAELKTPLADLEPWATTKIVTYWDTKGISLGAYNAKVNLYYEGKADSHNLDIYVVKPKELEKPLRFFTPTTLLVTILILVIIADIIWFIRKKGASKSTKKKL